MGYTHYWYRKEGMDDPKRYFSFAQDVKKIIDNSMVSIKGPDGTGEPELHEGWISFNGDASKPMQEYYGTSDESHETFHWPSKVGKPDYQKNPNFPGDRVFNFTKTAYKPYDEVVTAALIRAKDLYGDDVHVASDGSWEDWRKGRELYERTFGKDAKDPMDYSDRY